MKKIEAVIFDLDGTLLNTVEDIMDSVNSVLQKYGFPLHSLEEYLFFIGDGIEELVKRALPENRRNNKITSECLLLVKQEYKKRWHIKTKPYEGVKEMLFGLSRTGIKLSVFSNKPHDFTTITVKYYFPEINFDVVLGAKEGNPKKPDPWGALYIAEMISVSPKKILYLGDTKTDITTAKRAGMISTGAAWGFRGKKELEEAEADYLVDFPVQFLQLAKSLFLE